MTEKRALDWLKEAYTPKTTEEQPKKFKQMNHIESEIYRNNPKLLLSLGYQGYSIDPLGTNKIETTVDQLTLEEWNRLRAEHGLPPIEPK